MPQNPNRAKPLGGGPPEQGAGGKMTHCGALPCRRRPAPRDHTDSPTRRREPPMAVPVAPNPNPHPLGVSAKP